MAALQEADAARNSKNWEMVPATTATPMPAGFQTAGLTLSLASSRALQNLRKEWNRRRQELGDRKEVRLNLVFTSILQQWDYFATWKLRQSQYGKFTTMLKDLKTTRVTEGLKEKR